MTLDQAPALACALLLSVGAHLATMVVLPGPAPAAPQPARKVEMELYAPAPPRRVEVRPPSEVKTRLKLKPLAKPAEVAAPLPAQVEPAAPAPIVGLSKQSTAPPGDFAVPSSVPSGTGQAQGGGPGDAARAADSEPLLLGEVRIPYPDEARRSGVSGSVRLQVTIDAGGRVTRVSVISGPGFGLDEAAREALWKFRFKPGARRGAQVGSTFEYTYTFELD
jgi:protein TonB